MPRLVYAPSAIRDLRSIYRYISRESGDAEVATAFTERLRARCRRLADLGGTMGRDRSELTPELRSVPEGNYTILFRYNGQMLELLNIVHSARNLRRMLPRP